jgi:YggT family protein
MGVVFGFWSVIQLILNMIQILIFASVIASWLDADPRNRFVQMIHTITEPIFSLVRPITKHIPGPIDWAPFMILLIIVFLERTGGYYFGRPGF